VGRLVADVLGLYEELAPHARAELKTTAARGGTHVSESSAPRRA
jgi:hypothetical protein